MKYTLYIYRLALQLHKALLMMLTVGLLYACQTEKMGDLGPRVTKKVKVGDFNKLINSINADIYITQGPLAEIEIEAQSKIAEDIECKKTDEKLFIKLPLKYRQYERVKIYISAPQLNDIGILGSGSVIGQNEWNFEQLDFFIAGSGDIKAKLKANKLICNVAGSGDMRLTGEAQQIKVVITGSGDFDGRDLVSDEAKIIINGSGDAQIIARKSLDVNILGSGDVKYGGDPAQLDIDIQGSGQCTKLP